MMPKVPRRNLVLSILLVRQLSGEDAHMTEPLSQQDDELFGVLTNHFHGEHLKVQGLHLEQD
jgi:hypothetical protein